MKNKESYVTLISVIVGVLVGSLIFTIIRCKQIQDDLILLQKDYQVKEVNLTIKINNLESNLIKKEKEQKKLNDENYKLEQDLEISNKKLNKHFKSVDGGASILPDPVKAYDYLTLARIIESEAGGEDITGKILVANVILNRVKSNKFPNTITKVVFQRLYGNAQFSPIDDGAFARKNPSNQAYEAALLALSGEDYSKGALYFCARKLIEDGKVKGGKENLNWMDKNLNFLFRYGCHDFYK